MKLENKLSQFNRDLANILAELAYHISPEIVKYISNRNKSDFDYFKKLFNGKIEIANYLFEGSDCVFPGIRRYVGCEGKRQKYNVEYKAIIDDNIFPRHLWCFLINGKCYTGSNWKDTKLDEFELAHILTNNVNSYGEFTSAANVVLLPKGTIRLTDNSTVLKGLFYKRYIELYGKNTLENNIPDWYSELKWNEPFLPNNWKDNINKLLEYRNERISTILSKK